MAMVLSGGQSALAGAFFIFQSLQAVPAIAQTIAGYATPGALYFPDLGNRTPCRQAHAAGCPTPTSDREEFSLA